MELRERRSFLTVVVQLLGLSTRLFGASATAQRDNLDRMRKLIFLANALLKDDRTWSPAKP